MTFRARQRCAAMVVGIIALATFNVVIAYSQEITEGLRAGERVLIVLRYQLTSR